MIEEFTFDFDISNRKNTLKVSEIEKFIKSKKIYPVRFSLIKTGENEIKLCVCGIKK